jgi:hypothetical protein
MEQGLHGKGNGLHAENLAKARAVEVKRQNIN